MRLPVYRIRYPFRCVRFMCFVSSRVEFGYWDFGKSFRVLICRGYVKDLSNTKSLDSRYSKAKPLLTLPLGPITHASYSHLNSAIRSEIVAHKDEAVNLVAKSCNGKSPSHFPKAACDCIQAPSNTVNAYKITCPFTHFSY